jgi:hypothetical protein
VSDAERDRTVRQYRRFAEVEAVETSRGYAELAAAGAAVAEDDGLLDLLLGRPLAVTAPRGGRIDWLAGG